MLSPANIRANVLVKLGELTGKTHALPLVLFSPTARCNSRCVSCDWWRADGAGDLSLAEIETLAGDLERAGTRVVVLTGGEPLVRPDVMAVADLFRARGMALQLLTSGLALGRYADDVAARFQTVTVSLDGHTPELYRAIRGVDGLGAVADGVRKLRARAPHVGITARATIHRHNFRFLPDLVAKSRAMGLDQISFLAANVDASSEAFNRRPGLPQAADGDGSPAAAAAERRRGRGIRGDRRDGDPPLPRGARRAAHRARIRPGCAAWSAIYRAHLGQGTFVAPPCNAPWASLFIEADGAVRPCFFHPAVGNLRERPLADLLSDAMPAFRAGLDVATNPVCTRCVCSLNVGLRSKLW